MHDSMASKSRVRRGHAKRTPLKGLRFESLEEAPAYLDHWEERRVDTHIHGTTKRQVEQICRTGCGLQFQILHFHSVDHF